MHFIWHDVKAKSNLKKHRIGFEEAVSCFYDSDQVVFYDPEHSEDEEREILIGHSQLGRLLFVSYTLREETFRIISAREATKREAKAYAEGV